VQTLACSLSGQVMEPLLGHCTLTPEFWVALGELAPAVTHLQLQSTVMCSAPDVAMFSITRAADRPLTLKLADGVHSAIQAQQVQASLAARGVTHVGVVRTAHV
jgi:hypothetical protein